MKRSRSSQSYTATQRVPGRPELHETCLRKGKKNALLSDRVEAEVTKPSDNADDMCDRKHSGILRSGKVTFEQKPSENGCVWWQKVLAREKGLCEGPGAE